MKWVRRIIAVFFLALFAGFGGCAVYALTYGLETPPVPEVSTFEIDLARLAEAARASGGALPTAVHVEAMGVTRQPLGTIVAGRSLSDWVERVYPTFEIVFPAGPSLLVDASLSPRGELDSALAERFEARLAAARGLVFTHLHPDHTLALGRSARWDELADRIILTREQKESALARAAFPARSLDAIDPLDYDGFTAIAPGVVLLEAPGHTVGSQIVYVLLADDRELLLLGDVVWDMENIRSRTGRPAVIGSVFLRSDEEQVAQQISALYALMQAYPAVALVPSHDVVHMRALMAAGVVERGFPGS